MRPIDKIKIDGAALDARVERALLPGSQLVRSMNGASVLTMQIDDPDRVFFESGILARTKRQRARSGFDAAPWQRMGKVQLTFEGTFWRLAGLNFSGPVITLDWEPEIIAKLRMMHKHVRQSRRNVTRAGFIHRLLSAPPGPAIPRRVYQDNAKQPKERLTDEERDAAAGVGKPGITVNDGLAMKPSGGGPDIKLDGTQVRNINQALGVADDMNAPRDARIALILAFSTESNARNVTYGDRDSIGILQVRVGYHTYAVASSIEKSVRKFMGPGGFAGAGGAIELARKGYPPKQIANMVQAGDQSLVYKYDLHLENAIAIVDAYGRGGGSTGDGTRRVSRSYVFEAGNRDQGNTKEDYFQAIQRLAGEVNWRAFETMGIFIYGTDRDLLAAKPSMYLVERWKKGDPRGAYEVGRFESGEWHYNKPAARIGFTAQVMNERPPGIEVALDRWSFAPGQVAQVDRMGPFTGNWLVWEMTQKLDSEDVAIELQRPSPPKPEPRSTRTKDAPATGDEAAPEGGSLRDRIVKLAIATSKVGYNFYEQGGATGTDPTPPPNTGLRSDCSQWARAVYLKCGGPDPGTYTQMMVTKGRRVSTPRPGDLVFDPAGVHHVEMYIGDGKTIGHGSDPIDEWSVAGMKAYFGGVQFRSYID